MTTQATENLTYPAARKKVFKEYANKKTISNIKPTYAQATTHDPPQNLEITPSPIIRTNSFRNSTFRRLDNYQNSDDPITSELSNSRKRNLSDPLTHDPLRKQPNSKEPKKEIKQPPKSTKNIKK